MSVMSYSLFNQSKTLSILKENSMEIVFFNSNKNLSVTQTNKQVKFIVYVTSLVTDIDVTFNICSEILYPKEVCSPHSGVSSEHLCRGRDYVVS